MEPRKTVATQQHRSHGAVDYSRIAELLDIIDGFLRHNQEIANHLTDYLRDTGRDQPGPNSYSTDLVIDLVSFTAHALRTNSNTAAVAEG